jgi:Exo-beta-D-glucosaminidase Ig-fold domain
MKRVILAAWILLLALIAVVSFAAPQETRGVGIYLGDPSEDFAPLLVRDATTYWNLALHRPAFHSSSYDYNLTAQLVTAGIKDTKLPRRLATGTDLINNLELAQPALMVRLKAVRARSGDRILPVFYSDNYVSLMPGERRIVHTELMNADARGETPRTVVEGFNVAE